MPELDKTLGICHNGIGNRNSNGMQLLKTSAVLKLLITNSVFLLPLRDRKDQTLGLGKASCVIMAFGNRNSNGMQLLKTGAEHKLLITNSIFLLPLINRTSLMRPCSRHWHLINFVITCRKDSQDAKITKAICGAECWTDHRLFAAKL